MAQQNATISSQEEILRAFAEQGSKNQQVEVLKELFDQNKIYLISDLTKDEIKLATRIYMIAEMKNLEKWKEGLKFFVTLLLSRDRHSRRELLKAIASPNSNDNDGMFSNFNPFRRKN